jgi:predicted DsbA family dithiol-disulfide isomerase
VASVEYFTDPACPWSWALEPLVRKLSLDFGERLRWRLVLAGLDRDLRDPAARAGRVEQWLRVAERAAAPLDPLLWVDGPIESTYPACMAVKAAQEQGDDRAWRYLRLLREGLLCERRKLDHAEALVAEARGAGLDVERFRIDLRSHAITEAFGADLERSQALAAGAGGDSQEPPGPGEAFAVATGGAVLPAFVFRGEDGSERRVVGYGPYERLRDAAAAATGTAPAGAVLGLEEALARFGRLTQVDAELLCGLPGPRAGAELYRLAESWKARPVRVLTGYLWQRAEGA